MSRKITMNGHSQKSVAEVFEDFVISQTAQGLSEMTLTNYRHHFHSISRHFDIQQPMDALTKSKLEAMLQSCGDSAEVLISARKKLQKSNLYGESIKTQGLKTYSEKIAVSQEAELTAKYETEQNDVNALRKLLKELSSGGTDYEESIIEKWLPIISNQIATLENDELSLQFESAGNDRSELVNLRNTLIAVGSVYTKDTIKRWTAPITDKIVTIESAELSAKFDAIKSDRAALQKMIRDLPKLGYCSYKSIRNATEGAPLPGTNNCPRHPKGVHKGPHSWMRTYL